MFFGGVQPQPQPPQQPQESQFFQLNPMFTLTTPYTGEQVFFPIKPAYEKISLMPWQAPHYEELVEVMKRFPIAVSASETGSGKTYVTSNLYKEQKFNTMLIIGPASAEHTVWEPMFKKFGINGMYISYGKLRGAADSQPSHGLLTRNDYTTEGGLKKTEFFPTQKLAQLSQSPVLLVVDESHHAKNDSQQGKAVTALTSYIARSGGASRVMFLSATPFDKEKHAVRYMRLFGLLTKDRLYYRNPATDEIRLEGLDQILRAARLLNAERTAALEREYPVYDMTSKKAETLAWELYKDVLVPGIVRSMIRPKDTRFSHLIVNKFYNMSPESRRMYLTGIEDLANSTRVDRGGEADLRNMGAITNALVQIEQSKTEIFIRDARHILETIPNSKVVILLNYHKKTGAARLISDALRQYNPVLIVGGVAPKKRAALVNEFNTKDNVRVLVGSGKIASESISLDDKQGGRSRFGLSSPSYSMITATQQTGRLDRTGTLSDSKFIFVYGKPEGAESRILSAMARKAATTRNTIAGAYKEEAKLPDMYEKETEPDF